MQPVDHLGAVTHDVVAVLDQRPQHQDGLIERCAAQPGRGQRSDSGGDRVGVVVLAAVSPEA
jgi:hypothetical protein